MPEDSDPEKVEAIRPGQWMIKPCDWYWNEYKDCKCMKARFNQWFIYGELLNCKQWKIDYENCEKWKKNNDDESFKVILAAEKERRMQRLKPHYTNDVWTKRDKPPADWNDPLPEWLQKKQDGTLLDLKQKNIEKGIVSDLDMKLPLCTIL